MLAVKPSWAAMAKAAEQLQGVIEPSLKKVGTTLGETEEKIKQSIKDAVLPQINPLMDEHVKPHVQKILDLLRNPMQAAYSGSINVWEKMSQDYIKEVKKDKAGFKNYTSPINRPLWYIWREKDKLQECYDPLWLLNIVFPDIYPSSVIYDGKKQIENGIDSACYSYHYRMMQLLKTDENAVEKHTARLREEILEQLKKDSKIWMMIWYNMALKAIIMPPLMKIVNPIVNPLLSPVDKMVPDALKQIINVRGLFDEILNDLIDGIINPLFDFNIEKVPVKALIDDDEEKDN
jgi:hypothetical protein